MAAIRVMQFHPSLRFDILVISLTNITEHVPKHMVPFSYGDSMISIIDQEQAGEECCCTVITVQATSKPLVQVCKRPDFPISCEDWMDNISKAPKYTFDRTKFINTLEQFQAKRDRHPGRINTDTHRVDLFSAGARTTTTIPYRAGTKAL